MPKVRRSKKAPPEGWELIEPTLDELEQKMREGEHRLCTPNGCLMLFSLQLKLNHMKANVKTNPYGPYLKFIIKSHVTYSIYSTDVRRSVVNCTSTV